jgi:CDP-paratose 2-epimerase
LVLSLVVVTGSSGLIGSETVKFFHSRGFDIIGIDNNMREHFFGPDASVNWKTTELTASLRRFQHMAIDVRDICNIENIFRMHGKNIELVVHCAAQPSHDWAARDPIADFSINATGTLVLLEATRKFSPDAVFILMSTNKVYGDKPNSLPLNETERRWELDSSHPWGEQGIDETMSIDQSKHSIFGASKVAADIMVQEYGKYFDMRTGVFRGGCLTGPAHSSAELHGFLAYLVRCAVTGRPYIVYGYKGKQVRDNIHSNDLVQCFWHFYRDPKQGAVYNIGGSRFSNCSIIEAIDLIAELSGYEVAYTLSDNARSGDHVWWISDVRRFKQDFPEWSYTYDLRGIMTDLIEAARERLRSA